MAIISSIQILWLLFFRCDHHHHHQHYLIVKFCGHLFRFSRLSLQLFGWALYLFVYISYEFLFCFVLFVWQPTKAIIIKFFCSVFFCVCSDNTQKQIILMFDIWSYSFDMETPHFFLSQKKLIIQVFLVLVVLFCIQNLISSDNNSSSSSKTPVVNQLI